MPSWELFDNATATVPEATGKILEVSPFLFVMIVGMVVAWICFQVWMWCRYVPFFAETFEIVDFLYRLLREMTQLLMELMALVRSIHRLGAA